ncbi:MAG: hypothetical protein SV186_03330 [Candidatus Nanohaloarchaea archaeon]|nr:hypothetical protein [Candidatus Nanohaloarchaea archaeon]
MIDTLRDALDRNQQYGLLGVAVLLVAVGFGAGYVLTGGMGGSNPSASTGEIRQTVQSYMDQQLAQQRQQLRAVANQSQNISMRDLSIDAQVTTVAQSKIAGLYLVNVSVTGTVPSRLGGLRDISQVQTLYVSGDGSYLFQQPTQLTAQ